MASPAPSAPFFAALVKPVQRFFLVLWNTLTSAIQPGSMDIAHINIPVLLIAKPTMGPEPHIALPRQSLVYTFYPNSYWATSCP